MWLTMDNMKMTNHTRCLFGDQYIAAHWANNTTLKCRAPSINRTDTPVVVHLSVTENMQDYTNYVNFTYMPVILLISVEPSTLFIDTNYNVSITGYGFDSKTKFVFNKSFISPSSWNETEVICAAPKLNYPTGIFNIMHYF